MKARQSGHPEAAGERRSILILLSVASFLTPFMASSVIVALPRMSRELDLSAVGLGWVGTAYLLSAAVFLVPMGRLADMFGRRRVFTGGLGLFSLATLALGFVPNAPVLFSLRALQGVGGAMILSTAMPILVSVFPQEERGRALGVNVAAVYLGLSTGPLAGGALTEHLGWRSIFLVSAPLGALILVLLRRQLKREWVEARGERFDLPGALLYGGGLFLLIYGFSRLPAAAGALSIAAGLAALLAFAAWETRAASPILDIRLFRENTVFALSNLAALINYCATSAVGFLLSLYLQYIKGLSPQAAGMVLIAQPVVMTLVSPLAGRLSDRIEPRVLASAGMGLTTVGLCLLLMVRAEAGIAFIVATLLLLGLSFALFSAPNTNAVMSSVEKRFYGVASGTLGTMRLTGQMLSMGIATLLFAVIIGPGRIVPQVYPEFLTSMRAAFAIFALLCCLGVFASLARGKVRG